MTDKTPHVHAATIAEWSQDINRPVMSKDPTINGPWRPVVGNPTWAENLHFAFADSLIQNSTIVSSLTDQELTTVAFAASVSTYTVCEIKRSIANAAAAKAYFDLKMPADTWFKKHYHGASEIAMDAISQYINEVRKGYL